VKLLITDMLMPVMGGAALATALRRLNPALPIVATSATSSQPDSAHLEFTTAFLAKPFQTESLLAMVRRTLDEAGPQVVAPDPTPTPAAT
jgi:two-component system C4-dicarboxylate transport response regulator DctD